jgi:hypothetical protein
MDVAFSIAMLVFALCVMYAVFFGQDRRGENPPKSD